MKKVVVKNLSNVETHSAEFASQELADAWIAEQVAKGERCAWGRPAYSATVPRLDGNGDHQFTTSFVAVMGQNGQQVRNENGDLIFTEQKTYLFDTINYADQFTIEITDISAQAQLREAKAALISNRAFGQDMIVDFAIENVILGIDGAGTDNVLTKLNKALEALSNGYLETAIRKVKQINPNDFDGVFLSEARLLGYVNKIETHLGIALSTSL